MSEDELDNEAVSRLLPSHPHPETVRLIKQGHRRPSWDLCFEVEAASNGKVSSHDLRDARWYPKLRAA